MSDVDPSEFPAGRWRARWIWCEKPRIRIGSAFLAGAPDPAGRVGCFRRGFHLDAVPSRAPARITADSRFVLFVNGVEVARGPVRGNLRRLRYDLVDLAPHLVPGANAIAILARHYGSPNPWWAPIPAAIELGGGALVFEARLGEREWIASDGSWRALAADAWQSTRGSGTSNMPPECFDARRLPAGWREVGFDDSAWPAATVLAAYAIGFTGRHEPPSHPYGALLPRPIPQLTGAERPARAAALHRAPDGEALEDPVRQVRADLANAAREAVPPGELPRTLAPAPGEVAIATLDFGEVVSGTLCLELDAPPGARLDLAGAELVRPDGAIENDGGHVGLRYVARGAEDRFESFDTVGLRWLGISVRAPGPVTLRRVAVRERLCPRRSGPRFECSDPRLERIFEVGRRTVDLNSHDAYLDCPTREQRAWTGDFVVHQMVDLVTNPDWRLARWHVELAASPRPDGMLPMAAGGDVEKLDSVFIPDWALHWVRALHNLFRWTGDRALVARLLPVAENVLRWFVPFQAEDGLLADVTGWVIIDWSSVTTDGRSSVLNALFARGLSDFAEMSEWLGDTGRAAFARETRSRVAAGFESFFDPERELYVDHAVLGRRGRPASQHAQAAALAAGLVPAPRVPRIVEVMLDRRRHVHATWSRAKGDARHPGPGESGVAGPYLVSGPPPPWWDVEKQLVVAQPFFRYVVHDALAAAGREDRIAEQCLDWTALLERCPTSLSETWYGGTTCHGWSATPTRDLLTRTLGILPAEPGFGRARIAPRLGALEWARGAVPTPRGWLAVDASRERIRVESPLPFDLVREDGATTAHQAGTHVLPATASCR